MKKFLCKSALFFLPVFLLVLSFYVMDPFRLFKVCPDYSKDLYVIPNRDFISTEVYLKKKDRYHYNSFIFGSSRTLAYQTESWIKYLAPGARPFVFDASGESIFGIYTKIKYLDAHGANMDNCLIILCSDCTFAHESDHTGHLGIKHPGVAGTSWLHFYWVFFKAYLDRPFFKSYWRYQWKGRYDETMEGYIEDRTIRYDTITNDVRILDQEKEWMNDQEAYYAKRTAVFYERPAFVKEAKPQITLHQKAMLQEIYVIFQKHQTNYKLIISPLYNQVPLNRKDLNTLKRIFGEAVYDFSGKNAFTADKRNYFESSHYRPVVGAKILELIYGSEEVTF
jgi:hypothetical protein